MLSQKIVTSLMPHRYNVCSDHIFSLFSSPEICVLSTQLQAIDIGTLYDKTVSPLLYCARHLSYSFLLSERKGQIKSDRSVRVSVKSLALNCLAHIGSLEPLIWNSHLSDKGGIKHL